MIGFIRKALNAAMPKKPEQREIAAPSINGIRNQFSAGTGSLTTTKLCSIISAAKDGDTGALFTLSEEMLENYPHYRSVIDTRVRAVSGCAVEVESFSDDVRDVELADAVREIIRRPGFGAMVKGAMSAVYNGYSVSEIVWENGALWLPSFKYRLPQFFRYDRETGEQLRLLTDSAPTDGVELMPGKFIVHQPRLKPGFVPRSGLAMAAAYGYMCYVFTRDDWMRYADIHGMPFRIGKYMPGTSQADIDALKRAVRDIGSNAAATMPDSMVIEFQQVANSAAGGDFFRILADWWNAQISKLVLGQTRTSDQQSGGIAATSEVNNMDVVRHDILSDDAAALEETLNEYLVKPFIDFNFGPQYNYPAIRFTLPDRRNVTEIVMALEKLMPMGLEVEASWVRDMLGIPDPDDGAELLTAPQAKQITQAAQNRRLLTAMNRAENPANSKPSDTPDDVVAALYAEAQPLFEREAVGYIEALVNSSEYFAELGEKLDQAFPGMNRSDRAGVIQQALVLAELAGRVEAAE